MRTPKLIASDIDGTMLVNWAPRFSPQMLGLVERIVDAGIVFVPASGRQYTNLRRLFSPVADRIPYVCENGSLAILGDELVYRATMDDGLAREVIEDMLADPGCEPVVSGMRTVYVRAGAPELVDHLVNVTGYNVTELDDVTRIPEPFMKVSAYCTDGVPREQHWHERFGTRCTVKVTGLQWLDLMPNGVDKGVALSALAKRLGIAWEDFTFTDNALSYKDGSATPQGTPEEILAAGKKMYEELSPETRDFIHLMFDNELFDVLAKDGKAPGGYCTSLPDYQCPFIFSNFNGTSGDVDVLTHEAGHAFADFIASQTVAVRALSCPTMEGAETHSMSMEFLTAPWHHLFFGELTDKYELSHAEDALLFIPYGCLVDHFQEEVYRHPEMTPEERNQKWLELEGRYRPYINFDGLPFYGRGAGWQRQLHIYLYPFYYIDYCMAQVMSLQFYALSLEDREKAWEKYMAFVRQGGTKTFVDLAHSVDLRSPIDQGCVKDVCQAAFQWTEGHLVE